MHGIKLGGEGDVTATHRLWKREDLGVFVSSPAVYKGRIYLLRHRGGVVCLDPATGKTVWSDALPEDKSPYYASPTVASGIFYAAREDGVVFAVRVGERFELLGANPMSERIVASPVPVANRLLLSGDSHLFCVAGTDL
ncbi:MAG TPA: PQQ-binding-like beta-propeller repeat protein [Verrucomicrobiota bacterium]|nr:PQQ-binding-like beta-propeller repeat protein [Verrucomicrobiota bacterium]